LKNFYRGAGETIHMFNKTGMEPQAYSVPSLISMRKMFFKICLWFMGSFILLVILGFLCTQAGERRPGGRIHSVVKGEVKESESLSKAFGPGFFFCLEPNPFGWNVIIKDKQGREDLSRLTPPFHFVPNPREIEGWHFRNADNSGPNESGELNVNAPGKIRAFIFSPDVGKTIGGPDAKRQPTPEEIERIRLFGEGTLEILDYRLKNLEAGKQATFEWMRFKVELSWPETFTP
jgi:hypothetical protein